MIKMTLLFFGLLGAGLSVNHHYEARTRGPLSIQKQAMAQPLRPVRTACRLKSSDDLSRLRDLEQLAEAVSQ